MLTDGAGRVVVATAVGPYVPVSVLRRVGSHLHSDTHTCRTTHTCMSYFDLQKGKTGGGRAPAVASCEESVTEGHGVSRGVTERDEARGRLQGKLWKSPGLPAVRAMCRF